MKPYTSCHILFIASSAQNNVEGLIKQCHGKPILTVSDIDDFSRNGGIITMVQLENNIRFSINQQSLLSSGLRMSGQLLKLARELIQ